MHPKILLIEDEIKTANSIKNGLEEEGFYVDCAFDGATGLELAQKESYHVIVSDIMMPGFNGIELCNKLRSIGISVPILLLTALGTIDDKVAGFESGADDYLVKPFEFKELLFRIKSLLKRQVQSPENTNILKFSDIELNLDSKLVMRENQTIQLTAREFALMEYFLRNPNRSISKIEIAEKVWSINFDTGTNVIEVYVNYLRNKVDKNFSKKLIHTMHGLGYILKDS